MCTTALSKRHSSAGDFQKNSYKKFPKNQWKTPMLEFPLNKMFFLTKKDCITGFSCEICEFFQKCFYTEHLWKVASGKYITKNCLKA